MPKRLSKNVRTSGLEAERLGSHGTPGWPLVHSGLHPNELSAISLCYPLVRLGNKLHAALRWPGVAGRHTGGRAQARSARWTSSRRLRRHAASSWVYMTLLWCIPCSSTPQTVNRTVGGSPSHRAARKQLDVVSAQFSPTASPPLCFHAHIHIHIHTHVQNVTATSKTTSTPQDPSAPPRDLDVGVDVDVVCFPPLATPPLCFHAHIHIHIHTHVQNVTATSKTTSTPQDPSAPPRDLDVGVDVDVVCFPPLATPPLCFHAHIHIHIHTHVQNVTATSKTTSTPQGPQGAGPTRDPSAPPRDLDVGVDVDVVCFPPLARPPLCFHIQNHIQNHNHLPRRGDPRSGPGSTRLASPGGCGAQGSPVACVLGETQRR